MSIKNKTLDRNSNGQIKRKYTGPESSYWLCQTPKWWIKLYMTKPRRRENQRLCHAILKGQDPDGIAFPLGNSKPHIYYW
ncbi:hypothetical protein PL2TA16_00316 [Pseudoalteromonas luteoviolacea 2ta16]|uniref:Uncharacterized protein n=1 Tax=Pseudoalteromonas luteoviolacea (strain 2ta16) TaxID=1353533 RepID=V4J8F1_PSEL2|nr:hypothetical protein PL2TA16_00316 [Pseudoalteromonas luteoviolacea 2ta16]